MYMCMCTCNNRVMGTCVSSSQGLWGLLGLWGPYTCPHNLSSFNRASNV